MERELEASRTLLVSGPASVTIIKGRVEALGTTVPVRGRVVIRRGRAVPFRSHEKSVIDVVLGENAEAQELTEDTVPTSWRKSVDEVLALRPCIVMVIGDVDCGKTTFCTFLTNKALAKTRPIAIIDADIGQADIGSPTTIGLGIVKEPITDLFTVKARNAHFVGVTSPSEAADKVIQGLITLKREATDLGVNFIIINTDGWIQGDEAKSYKVTIARTLKPTIIIGIQRETELSPILSALEADGMKVYRLEASVAVKKRDREERRRLRELGYKKFLSGSKLSFLPISWVKIENAPLGTGRPLLPEETEEFENVLGREIVYGEETPDTLFLVLKEGAGEVKIAELKEKIGRKVHLVAQGEEKGLLVSLLDDKKKFLGLGVLVEVNYKKRVLRIATPVKVRASVVQFGRVKLTRNGEELGVSDVFAM